MKQPCDICGKRRKTIAYTKGYQHTNLCKSCDFLKKEADKQLSTILEASRATSITANTGK